MRARATQRTVRGFLALAFGAVAVIVPAAASATWGQGGGGQAFARAGTWAACAAGSVTLAADRDADTQEGQPNVNNGAGPRIEVKPGPAGGRRHAFVRFPAPAVPAGCAVSGLTLRLYRHNSPGVARAVTIDVVASPWQEGSSASCTGLPPNDPCGVTWTNSSQLAFGAATTWSAPANGIGPLTADVTALGLSAHGYRLRDLGSAINLLHSFASRQDTTPDRRPQLVVAWA